MMRVTVTMIGVVAAAYSASGSGSGATTDGYTVQAPGSGETWEPGHTRPDDLFVHAGRKGEIPVPDTCVRATGTVGEFPATSAKGNPQSLTQLTMISVSVVQECQEPTSIPAIHAPMPDEAEALGSMFLAPQDTQTVTDNYQTNQYNTLTLTPGKSPLRSATGMVAPRQAARDYEIANAIHTIALDDGTSTNLLRGTAAEVVHAYLANDSPVCVGYHVSFTRPVVFEPRHGSPVFQPTSVVAGHPDYSPVIITGECPNLPTVGGDTRVATFNVLNYFSDPGINESGYSSYSDRTSAFVTAKKYEVHGAFSREAFTSQEAKIVNATSTLGADVVVLEEIGNPVVVGVGTDRDATSARLVEALNEAAGDGTWAYMPSPSSVSQGEGVIRIAFIYEPAIITPVGPSLIHGDPTFTGLARQPLAQEFAHVTGWRAAPATFVVIGSHFKSKGSVSEGAPPGNADNGDGQGDASAIRVAQATLLTFFTVHFADKPTPLVGDFNSYSQENPTKALEASDWAHVPGAGGTSYVYTGRSGPLDHVFSNAAAKPLLSGVVSWAASAQEPIASEYLRTRMSAHLIIEAGNPYHPLDHSSEIVGLILPHADDTILSPTALETSAPSGTPSPAPRPGTVRTDPVFSHGAPSRATCPQHGLPYTGLDTDRAVDLGITLVAVGSGLILLSHRTRRRG